MADYAISNVARRVVYANTGVGPYAFTFEILANTDIAVYRGSTLLTLTTDYSVTINANGTGSVTLVTAGTGNITIVGARAIQRTSDYTTGGDLFASTLNTDLDSLTIYVQQVAETAERGLKAPVVDPTDIAMTLPAKDNRKGKVLAFDSTTGNPVAGPALDAVTTVIAQSANINTVADNIASVNTVAGNTSNINTVAGVSSNVTTVAGSISNVNTVADDLNEPVSEIHTVGTNITNVNNVGNNIANVNTVAGNSTNINTVAGISGNVTTVAGISGAVSNVSSISSAVTGVNSNSTNINTVAGQISPTNNIATVAGVAADVDTVAGISANVTSVAGNSTNINTVATNIANVNSVGGNIANVNSVAGNSTNINNVAGNSANINTVAGISSNVTTVATNNANVTTVATNIANVNTNATNIANINQNAANIVAIQGASANATNAANSATAAAASATSASNSAAAASAVALGNEPVRHSVRPSLLLDFANTKTLDPRITFTRASTATFYDGKTVAKAEENLLLQSQTFDTVTNGWTVDGITLSANNTAAPDGTTTAELLTATAVNQGHYIYGSTGNKPTLANTTYTLSIFAKANGYNHVTVSLGGNSSAVYAAATFDLSAVTVSKTGVGGTGGTLTSSSITSVGNSWYRLVITGSVTEAAGYIVIGLNSSGTPTYGNYGIETFTGNGTSGVFLWGAQLEQRSSVTAYTATTTAPITNYIPALQTAASGVARFEHNPVTGESLGLEIEEQRSNLILQSQFASGYTTVRLTVNTNVAIAPDGTLTASKFIPTSVSGSHALYRAVTVTSGSAHTWSGYFKAGEYNTIHLNCQASSSIYIVKFDLTNGTSTNVSGTGTATITSVGNGWYRCTATATTASTTAYWQFDIYDNSGNTSYAGNDWNGVYAWGAQLEAGSFATSYIPTVASQVTRSADAASMTGTNFSSWYRADEWTLYGEAENRNGVVSTTNYHIALLISGSSASTAQIMRIRGDTNAIQSYGSNGSEANQWVISNGSGVSRGSFAKGALAYKVNDVALSSGGTAVSTDTGAQIPELNTLQIGIGTGSAQSINGSIRKLAYYPKRLTNAELQGLTTV